METSSSALMAVNGPQGSICYAHLMKSYNARISNSLRLWFKYFSTIFSNPQIHYDDTFNSDTSDVTTYINSMVTHLQAHFCQISLGTQIQVEVSILWYLLELFLPIWYPTDFCKNFQKFAHSIEILGPHFLCCKCSAP